MAVYFRNAAGGVQSAADGFIVPEGWTVLTETEARGDAPALFGDSPAETAIVAAVEGELPPAPEVSA